MADYQLQFTGPQIDQRLAAVTDKQDRLVSGTNIKTVGGQSILGSGDIPIQAGDTNAVQYVAQELTEAQKQQARANINAASLADIQDMDFVTATERPTASASTMGHIYLIGPDANNNYDRYYTQESDGTYSWVSLGSTQMDLSTYATKSDLSQLQQKVDDLSTGKYYGYFATSADLPDDATVDGFAYVGEGPTYTIYNCVGGVWTSSDITVNQSPIGNDEDIDRNEDGKLQFANRVYDENNPNGMGYKILRPDATFSSQVSLTSKNTIFEIRYDFNLGGATKNLPEKSVLKFNGGKIINGTISGNKTIISAGREQVFDNVALSGSFLNEAAFPEWWGAKADGTTDDRAAIQSAIASLFRNISFADRIYLVSSTNPDIATAEVGLSVGRSQRLVGMNTKRTEGSYTQIVFSGTQHFDVGLLINYAGVFVSNINFIGDSSYNVDRMVSTSLNGNYRQELKFDNVRIQYANTFGLYLTTYLSKLDDVRVQDVNGDAYYIGGTATRYPMNLLSHCYAVNVKGVCYNCVNLSAAVFLNCYAELGGYDATNEVTNANSVPAFKFTGVRGVSLIGCGTEKCIKPIYVDGGQSIDFVGCSFHSFVEDGVTVSGDIEQYVLTGTLNGVAFKTCNLYAITSPIIGVGSSVKNLSIDSCVVYTSIDQTFTAFKYTDLSSFDELEMSVTSDNSFKVFDFDAYNHKAVKNTNGSIATNLESYSNGYDFFEKTLTVSGGSQGSSSKTLSNYRGRLVIQYPGATSADRASFYAAVNINNCKEVVFKDMYSESPTTTYFKFTNSTIIFDGCVFSLQTGRSAFMTLNNCTVILRNCSITHPERAPQDYLLSALDPTSVIIIEDATGKYLTQDGRRGVRSVTTATRPSSAPVGEAYYDETLSKPIWCTGSGWVDATGTAV